jgi:HAE1 family hydrophobic/amphiphilic exporter-1
VNLIRLCLARPVGVSVGVLLVLLFGLLSLFMIPVQLTPNVDVPIVTVTTRWQGANPQEIEQEIVHRQEEQLRSVQGLRKMTSQSRDNEAAVTLEFYAGADRSEALRDVTDKLRQVSNYPLEVDQPTVVAADSSTNNAIAWLILYNEPGNAQDVTTLRDFAEDNIKPYLDRVKGVASVEIYGGREREVQVRVDAGELAARGLTFRQVQQALRNQNANISAGVRTQGKRDYAVRTVGQYTSPEEVRDTVVAYTPGGPVYTRDIAEVELSFKRQQSFVRSKGQGVLAFPVRRETGANVIQVMDGVKKAVQQVNEEVLEARRMRLELTQVYDETVYIRQAIRMVEFNAIYGGVLTVIVLMLFLRNWRASATVALAIPISVVGTFVVVVALGRTLNVISLAGIAFSIGMVVDNSIVVLENIYRHRQMGKDFLSAAYDGTYEVWGAVVASTLTTMAVFIPVIFVEEEAGQLFRDISIATATSVGLSLIVSITVVPPLARRLLGLARRGDGGRAAIHQRDDGDSRRSPAAAGANAGPRTAGLVSGIVAWLNERPLARLGVIVALSVSALALTPSLIPDATYLPAGNRNLVFGSLLTPPGYSLDEFRRMADVIERGVRPYWESQVGSPQQAALDEDWRRSVEAMIATGAIPELDPRQSNLGPLERARAEREWRTPPPLIDNFFFVSFQGGCFMGCSSRDPARVKPLVRLLEAAGRQIPGAYPFFQQATLFSFGGGNNAEIQVRGDDLDKVTAAADALFAEGMKRFGFPQPNPANYNLGRPEVRIVTDRERAADLGLTPTDVGLIVEACGDGAYVGDYREQGGRTIDIALYVSGQQNRPTQEITQVPVFTPTGRLVPLSAAVNMIETTAAEQINHIERQRSVTLTIKPPETVPLAAVIRQIKHEIEPELRKTRQIDPEALISLTGNADKLATARAIMVGQWAGFTLQSAVNLLASRFFLSVLICYLLMVALYESWLYPFVIMFSVPLAVFGGFLGLTVCHLGTLLTTHQPVQQLDVLTFLGFVILVGTVVNNAILLVDQSLQNMRDHGRPPHDAIREAVRTRVRPVLMTSLTTVFGQLPLALMPGAGSELYRGLAAVTVGGMLVATLGTLVLVPAVLGLVLDVQARLRGALWGAPAAAPARGGRVSLTDPTSPAEPHAGPETPSASPAATTASRAVSAASAVRRDH